MSHRLSRLAETIKKEISAIIQQELKDPRVGFASITAVDVSGDLRYAKVYISVLGDATQKKDTLTTLKRAQGFIRTELSRRVKLRYTPELQFELDDSINHATKVMKLLREVNKEGE